MLMMEAVTDRARNVLTDQPQSSLHAIALVTEALYADYVLMMNKFVKTECSRCRLNRSRTKIFQEWSWERHPTMI